jgi:hypothetical protein
MQALPPEPVHSSEAVSEGITGSPSSGGGDVGGVNMGTCPQGLGESQMGLTVNGNNHSVHSSVSRDVHRMFCHNGVALKFVVNPFRPESYTERSLYLTGDTSRLRYRAQRQEALAPLLVATRVSWFARACDRLSQLLGALPLLVTPVTVEAGRANTFATVS